MVFLMYAVTQISTAMQKFLMAQGVLAMQKSVVMQKSVAMQKSVVMQKSVIYATSKPIILQELTFLSFERFSFNFFVKKL